MALNNTNGFFRKKRDVSEIKSEVLIPFVEVWFGALQASSITSPVSTARYLDLILGLTSDDATSSAIPARLLHAIYRTRGSRLDLNKSIETYFYDPDTAALQRYYPKLYIRL